MSNDVWMTYLWFAVAVLWVANLISLVAINAFANRAAMWKFKAFEALETAEKLAERLRALQGGSPS